MSTSETLDHDQFLTEPDETGEHGHASDALYVKVFIVLFLITAAEVATYVVDIGDFLLPALMVMMSVKFAIVVGYFMHLRFDSRLLTWVFVAGLALAIVVYIVALTTFEYWQA
jgi:cytochrome c oxidase subunit IV